MLLHFYSGNLRLFIEWFYFMDCIYTFEVPWFMMLINTPTGFHLTRGGGGSHLLHKFLHLFKNYVYTHWLTIDANTLQEDLRSGKSTVADKKKFPLRLRSTLNAYMKNSYKTFTKR